MPPDGSNESGVARPLASLRSRLAMLDALRSIAVVAPLAVVSALVAIRVGAPAPASVAVVAAIAVVGAVLWLWRRSPAWSAAAAARAVERMHGDSRNVVVTAEELLRHPDRARPAIRERVFGQAAVILARDRRATVPLMRPAIAAGVSSAIAITLALGWPQRAVVVMQQTARDVATAIGGGEGAFSVRVIVTPPGYTGQPSRTVENPERIDVLEGSRMRVVLTRGDWRVRFGTEALSRRKRRAISASSICAAIRSGYLAFEPTDPSQADKRRLVPVTVAPDRAPTIRIEAPAKDLLLPDATPTVRITATATDDLGLRSLDLRYTRISGSGEQFEFQEGTIPIAVAQESPRSWKARAELPLPKLSLNPGDSVVYRVVGRDQRAGDAGMATSDTFFIEIAGPNQVALPGFELPPEQERYAMSQQMIVLKLERLRARGEGARSACARGGGRDDRGGAAGSQVQLHLPDRRHGGR